MTAYWPIGRHQTVHLDGQLTYIWTIQLYVPESSKWTVHICVFGWSKYMVSRRPFGRLSFVQMKDTCSYIWMRPNQRNRDVQMDGSGMSKWTYIQIDGESPLIWTVQLAERPNKRPYTVNLDVQITPFGLWSLYGNCPRIAKLGLELGHGLNSSIEI